MTPVPVLLRLLGTLFFSLAIAAGPAPRELPDLSSVAPDLTVPTMTEGVPAPGRRVRVVRPEYAGTQVYHTLYLPADWKPGRRYPVIVEYAGNGPYANAFGDISTGYPEGSRLGYGISAGKGFLWLCLPYVNAREKRIQTQWWGDVEATLEYARKTVVQVCEECGGDPAAVLLAGFSRGAIGCGYLGLHEDVTADIWLGFIAYSHYDGARSWAYPGSDPDSARRRLQRLKGRASFICHEGEAELDRTRRFIESAGVTAPFTYRVTPFRNHSDAWTLRPSPERKQLRQWVRQVLETRPGTSAVRGRVTDRQGRPVAGARVSSGETHWSLTNERGRYSLRGLVPGARTIAVAHPGHRFGEPRTLLLGRDRPASCDFRE